MRVSKFALCLALLPALNGCSDGQNAGTAQAQVQSVAVSATNKVLIDTDFGTPGTKLREIKSEKVNGSLTEPWMDESNWAPLRVDYKSMSADGQAFQRMVVSQLQSGRGQMVHELPALSPDAMYVLEMRLRGAPAAPGVPQGPLTVGVRQREAPYEFTWQDSVTPNRDWQDVTFTFSPKKSDTPVGFYLMTDSNGTIDIARVKLQVTTREEYIKTLEAKYPGGGPRNLLTQSRFPMGLPVGWKLDVNWGDDRDDAAEPIIQSDDKVLGMGATPSLHVQGQRAFILNSAPFSVVLPHRKHVASVALRGSGNGSWGVYVGDKEIASQKINLDNTEWKRYDLEFSPDLTAKSHTLRFQSEGGLDLWMDAVQVASAEAAREYATQMPAEVSLSSGSQTGIHFTDQPAQIAYSVAGDLQNATLKSRVVNIYGEEATVPAVSFHDGKSQSGTLAYAQFPNHPLGVYRVEAWVEDAAGKRISPYAEVVVNRLRRPRHWGKDAPNSPFGVHMTSNTPHILMAKSTGINWTRLHDAGASYIGWDFLEREKGKWKFRDTKLERYRRNHIKILGGLSTTPQWARTMKESHDGFADRWSQPTDMADYANYVKTVTQRYKGVIDAYEIWNEPWLSKLFWHTHFDNGHKAGPAPQRDYARLMQAGYKAAKAVDPNITIAGINTTTHDAEPGFIEASQWTRGVVENGGLQACDVISYHQYMGSNAGFPGDEVEKGFHKGLDPILQASGQKMPRPVWMTEGSSLYGTSRSQGFYRYTLAGQNNEDNTALADKLCRYVVAMLGQGVEKVFLYSMATAGSEWAVLVNFDNSLHPSGAAHSNMAWQLEDTKFSKRMEVAPNVFAFLFSGKGRAVAVLAPKEQANYKLPMNPKLMSSDLWGNTLAGGAKLGPTLSYVSLAGSVSDLERALRGTAS